MTLRLQEDQLQHRFSMGSENLLREENSRSLTHCSSVNLALVLVLSLEFGLYPGIKILTKKKKGTTQACPTGPGATANFLLFVSPDKTSFPPALTLLSSNIIVLTAQGTRSQFGIQ